MNSTSRPLSVLASLQLVLIVAGSVGAQEDQLIAKHRFDRYMSTRPEVVNLGDLDKDGFPEVAVGDSSAYYSRAAGEVIIYSTRDMRPRLIIDNPSMGRTGFAQRVVKIGDQDADGLPDLLVSAEDEAPGGACYVFSSRTGKQLLRVATAASQIDFGEDLTSIGDADSDGFDDFVVSNDGRLGMEAFSGRTGKRLYVVNPGANEYSPGQQLERIPDANGDKIDDFVARWERLETSSQARGGGVRVHSGKDGSTLFEALGVESNNNYRGDTVAVVGDRDGDKIPDIAVLEQTANGFAPKILNTRTGQTIWRSPPAVGTLGQRGLAISNLGDLDGDGVEDFGVWYFLTPDGFQNAWYLYSTKTGKHLGTVYFSDGTFDLAYHATTVGDLDGDGHHELFATLDGSPGGALALLSTVKRTLRADRYSVSILKPEPQVLSIDVGEEHAGQLAFVIGSASGTSPGISLGSLQLFLNLDSYMTLTLSAPQAVIYNNLRVLDAQGRGKAAWILPKGVGPQLSGLRLDHAVLILGSSGFETVTLPMGVSLRAF